MKKVGEWFRSLPPSYQFLVIAIVAFVVWRIYVKFTAYQKANASSVAQKAELKVLEEKGIKPSFAQYTYDSWAEKLYTAMKGAGTDEGMIFSVFKQLKNDVDFIRLDQAFGIRDTYTMRVWLKDDLSSSDIQAINAGLKVKGLTKRI